MPLHLNSHAQGAGVVLGAEAGVAVRPVQTGSPVGAPVVLAHVHLAVAGLAGVARRAAALVAGAAHAAVPVSAGTRGAAVGEEAAAPALPALGAAAVVGIEEVPARPSVQAGVRLAHGAPGAARERRAARRLCELLLLRPREVHGGGAEVRQGNAAQLHGAQAAGEGPAGLGGQAPEEDVHAPPEEVQAAPWAPGRVLYLFVQHQSPAGGRRPRRRHEQVHAVPLAVAHARPAAEAEPGHARPLPLLSSGTVQLHEEEASLDGERDEGGVLLGVQDAGVALARAELQGDAGEVTGDVAVSPERQHGAVVQEGCIRVTWENGEKI